MVTAYSLSLYINSYFYHLQLELSAAINAIQIQDCNNKTDKMLTFQ